MFVDRRPTLTAWIREQMVDFSKTQIDKLGDRLRRGDISEADVRQLDEYRRSFTEAYEFVIEEIRSKLKLAPTGRPAKSTTSISEKLLRESIRLTQIQDLAGCRLVVSDVAEQRQVAESLCWLFGHAKVVDRRAHPSHGYRAVHIIVTRMNKPVEIQVRTSLQHIWAELSEKLSDVVDSGIKYGKGDQGILEMLLKASALVAQEENQEVELAKLQKLVSAMLSRGSQERDKQEQLIELQREVSAAQEDQAQLRNVIFKVLRDSIERVPTSGVNDAVSD